MQKITEDTGVAILPGYAFIFLKEELTARLAFINFDGAQALAMSETIPLNEKFKVDFAGYCFKLVFDAMENIVNLAHN